MIKVRYKEKNAVALFWRIKLEIFKKLPTDPVL